MSASTVDLMITLFLISASFPFITGFFNWYYGWKLMSYIKQKDYSKYQYLWGNTFAGFGDPISNFLIVHNYIYSDDDEEDENIKIYKNRIKLLTKYFLRSGLLMIIMGVLMSVIAYFDESNLIRNQQTDFISRSLHNLITI